VVNAVPDERLILSPRPEDGGDHRREGLTSAGSPATAAPDPASAVDPQTAVTRDAGRDTDVTPPAGRRDTDALRAANAHTITALIQQRKVKRMLRTRAQKDADKHHEDAQALTVALAALGHEDPTDDGTGSP
jgi:hypothetical protein